MRPNSRRGTLFVSLGPLFFDRWSQFSLIHKGKVAVGTDWTGFINVNGV